MQPATVTSTEIHADLIPHFSGILSQASPNQNIPNFLEKRTVSPKKRALLLTFMSSPNGTVEEKKPKKQQHLQVDRSSTFVYDLILWIFACKSR
jgi:hypothetical protein